MPRTCKKLSLDTTTAEDLVDSADTAAEELEALVAKARNGSD